MIEERPLPEFKCAYCGNTDKNKTGCPKCRYQKRSHTLKLNNLKNPNNVYNLYPYLQEETEEDLRLYTKESEIKILWKCKDCGNEWKSVIASRTVLGTGCPECAKGKIWDIRRGNLPKERFLKWGRPDLWEEVVDKEEAEKKQYLIGSDYKILWKCSKCGREWRARIYSRTGPMNAGCVKCSHKESWLSGKRSELIKEENLLKNVRPDLYKELLWAEIGRERVTKCSQKKVLWQCSTCGHIWEATPSNRTMEDGTGCPNCNPKPRSQGEILLYKVVKAIMKETGEEVVPNYRGLGSEIDIWVPSRGIGIEYNGCYWHSEYLKGKDAQYNKRKLVESKGYRVIQIWEDDFKYRQLQVIKLLMNVLGQNKLEKIHARKCVIGLVTKENCKNFLEENHIQGYKGGSINLGLYYEEQQVALGVFSRTNRGWLNLERYATNAQVRGGLSKIIAYVKRNYSNGYYGIETFADCDISQGNMYYKCGFQKDYELPPDYKYLIDDKRVHKFNYRKERFRTDPNLKYEEGLTEFELADLNKLFRCWDSGKIKFIYRFKGKKV